MSSNEILDYCEMLDCDCADNDCEFFNHRTTWCDYTQEYMDDYGICENPYYVERYYEMRNVR